MPIYEYQCEHCHYQFERMQKINEQPLRDCPSCAQSTVVKLVSSAGFQLKGSGWYVTDFKNKADKKSDTTQNTTPSTAEKSTTQKTLAGSEN